MATPVNSHRGGRDADRGGPRAWPPAPQQPTSRGGEGAADDVNFHFRWVILIGLITASTFCIISPVVIHRILFRRRAKDELVKAANKLTMAGLMMLGLALVCATALIVDVVIGRTAGYISAGLCVLLVIALWVVLPRILLRRSDGQYE